MIEDEKKIVLDSKRSMLEVKLETYLSEDPVRYRSKIIATRGRLLRILEELYDIEKDVNTKNSIQDEIKYLREQHVNQLNNEISENKKNGNGIIQIPKELGLKFKKLANSINNLKNSKDVQEGLENTAKVFGNTISLAGTTLKIPIVAAITLGSKIAPIVGKIIVQPLKIPGYLYSKIINPDAKYNGSTINKMGTFIGEKVGQILDGLNKSVKKL